MNMNVRELRKLKTQVMKVAREHADKFEKQKEQHKNLLYEEATVRFFEKQNVAKQYGYILEFIPWNGIALVACMCIIAGVILNFSISFFSSPQPYVPGARAIDVSNGKQRNASDFVKNVILYGNSRINFSRFVDDDFPMEKLEKMQKIFSQLRNCNFDTSCSLAIADENGEMDFDIEFSSTDMAGMLALRLNANQQFKIINLEKWR